MKPHIHFVLPFLPALLLTACQAPSAGLTVAEVTDARNAVIQVLTQQQKGWNVGLIDEFMAGYRNSPEMMFVSGGTVKYGWQTTRDGFHARYDTDAKMGRLTFSDVAVRVLTRDAAVATGAWRLEREMDEPSGRFTLLLRKFQQDWKIVLDHTSSDPDPGT